MTRKLRLLATFTAVALIGAIGAGCGSHGSSETGASNSTGTAAKTGIASTGTAGNIGTAGNTSTTSKKRATDRDKNASPSSAGLSRPARLPSSSPGSPGSAGLPPAPARHLPPASTQSTQERNRHE
jgi:hypothetical protein